MLLSNRYYSVTTYNTKNETDNSFILLFFNSLLQRLHSFFFVLQLLLHLCQFSL